MIDRIDIRIGEFGGYCATKVAEDKSETTYVSLGRENAYGHEKGIAIVDMNDIHICVIGTDGFYEAIYAQVKSMRQIEPITDCAEFRNIALGHAAAELIKNPSRFQEALVAIRKGGIEEGEEIAKTRIREALGI